METDNEWIARRAREEGRSVAQVAFALAAAYRHGNHFDKAEEIIQQHVRDRPEVLSSPS